MYDERTRVGFSWIQRMLKGGGRISGIDSCSYGCVLINPTVCVLGQERMGSGSECERDCLTTSHLPHHAHKPTHNKLCSLTNVSLFSFVFISGLPRHAHFLGCSVSLTFACHVTPIVSVCLSAPLKQSIRWKRRARVLSLTANSLSLSL